MNKLIDFSISLTNKLLDGRENAVFSPFSITLALSMLKQGAAGVSREELDSIPDIIPEFCRLKQEKGLKMTNCIAVNNNTVVKAKKSFIDALNAHFDASVIEECFNDSTKDVINSIIEKSTEGEIKNFLDSLSKKDIALLINTLLYENEWRTPFSSVEGGIFNSNGKKIDVVYLYRELDYYFQSERALAFELELKRSNLSLVCVLPNGSLTEYIKALDYNEYASLIGNKITSTETEAVKASIALPIFDIEHSCEPKSALKEMGFASIFNENKGDFSKGFEFPKSYNVYVSRALHKCKLEVSQKGLKASAVSILVMAMRCCLERIKKVPIILDKPFLFLVIDKENKLPIFMGSVVEPTKA